MMLFFYLDLSKSAQMKNEPELWAQPSNKKKRELLNGNPFIVQLWTVSKVSSVHLALLFGIWIEV